MPGTSQGNAYPEYTSIAHDFTSTDPAPTAGTDGAALSPPPGDAEWSALVTAAVAAVSEIEAAQQQADTADPHTEATVTELLEAQPAGSHAFSLPIAPGASTHVPTWVSRKYWLALCEWVITHTDRGRAALKRHGIAAATFVRGCGAHAEFAESATGRRMSASLGTLTSRSGLSKDQLKRCRRVLKSLELGLEQVRGKKLDGLEREAAARHYEQIHGHAPARPQTGAASVWALSAPQWAVEAMPAPEKKIRRCRRPAPSRKHRVSTTRPEPSTTSRSVASAPQSLCRSFHVNLSARKDHQARGRAGSENPNPIPVRSLELQRAAAQLVERIPALRGRIGINHVTGQRRGHIGSVCDLLVEAGIDTDRWTGIDIADALTLDGTKRGWTWPTTESMTSPLRLVAFRLSQIDWLGVSPTESKTRGRELPDETPAQAAHRLVQSRRRALASTATTQAPPASAEHRRAIRTQFAAFQASRQSDPVRRIATPVQHSSTC
ncbi:hypothetical protein ACWDUD_27925 [Rhodococcus sp. NPDC003382]